MKIAWVTLVLAASAHTTPLAKFDREMWCTYSEAKRADLRKSADEADDKKIFASGKRLPSAVLARRLNGEQVLCTQFWPQAMKPEAQAGEVRGLVIEIVEMVD